MDVVGTLNRASSPRGIERFVAVRDVASLMNPILTSVVFSAGGIPKGAQLSRREHIQRKSFWQFKFVRKELVGSQTVADKSLTDVRR